MDSPVPTCLHREIGSDFSTPSTGDSRMEPLSHSSCCSQGSNPSLEALQALSHAHPWHWHGQLASPSKDLARCVPHSHGTLRQGLPTGKVGTWSFWSRGWVTPVSEP